MKKKIIIGTSTILFICLFVCAFTLLSDKDSQSDGFIDESITTVPVEEAITSNQNPAANDAAVSHEFRIGSSESIPTLPLTLDGMIDETITVVPADSILEEESLPSHSFTPGTP